MIYFYCDYYGYYSTYSTVLTVYSLAPIDLVGANQALPIETTTTGPSPLSAVMPDSRDLYSGYEVCSMIYHNKLLAQQATFILGIVGVREGRDCGRRAKSSCVGV